MSGIQGYPRIGRRTKGGEAVVKQGLAPYWHQGQIRPSKPVWWDRVKNKDGTWTATPYYGKPVKPGEESK